MNNSDKKFLFSVVIDKTHNENISSKDACDDDNFILLHENNIFKEDSHNFIWLNDQAYQNCSLCQAEFSVFSRKHHCRYCGKIFCYYCCSEYLEIPSFLGHCLQYEADHNGLINMMYSSKKQRLCSVCFKKIKQIEKLKHIFQLLNLLPITLKEIYTIACVSRSWNLYSKYYKAYFKKIQYYFNDHQYTERDRNILWLNRYLLIGHSNWLIPLLKSMSWKTICKKNEDIILFLLCSKKKHNCNMLQCENQCHSFFTIEDTIISLFPYIYNDKVRNYLLESLAQSSISEILCFLPFLVYLLRQYSSTDILKNYLISIASVNYEFCNSLFWELSVQMKDNKYSELYSETRKQLIQSIENETKQSLEHSYTFIDQCIPILDNYNVDQMRCVLQNLISSIIEKKNLPISSPLNPYILIHGINTDKIRCFNSYTKPISIPFYYDNNRPYRLLYKKEDLRKDQIIINIIKVMDKIIKDELGLDIGIVTYNVLPITPNSGFIEMIEDADTVYNIKKNFSIQNFIIEHNKNCTVDELRRRFANSCAGYCVINFLLGIGDRHLDNIMITNSGKIFHVDFGYILGHDPKPMAPEIRITMDMIEAMGGIDSDHYTYFQELCSLVFNCLRKHSKLFHIMLSMLYLSTPVIDPVITKQTIDMHIMNRFLPGDDYREAKIFLIKKVENCKTSYTESLIDIIHHHNKSNIITNGVNLVASNAYNLGSNFVNLFIGNSNG